MKAKVQRPITRPNAARMLARIKRDFDKLLIFAPTDVWLTEYYRTWELDQALKSATETLQKFQDIYDVRDQERNANVVTDGTSGIGEVSLDGAGSDSNARLFSAGSGGE